MKKDRFRSQEGYTLIELMLAVAILAMITPAITIFFSKVTQGYAADEMHTQLKTNNQNTLNRLHARIGTSKRLFLNDATGTAFLAAVSLTGGAPNVLGGSHLPLVQTDTLSPAAGAVSASFGNCLFFAAYDQSQTLVQGSPVSLKTYPAPATLTGLVDGAGNTDTVYINLYRFYYYYLTTSNPRAIRNVPSYALIEWQSVQYADYQDLSDLAVRDATLLLQKRAVTALSNMGVTMAFDTSQTTLASAFHGVTVLPSTPVTIMPSLPLAPATGVTLFQQQWANLTQVQTGMLTNGFRYGIACNSAQWKDLPVQVPQFGVTNVSYPGGFEVGLGGTAAGREVMIRSVLAAQGASPKVATNDLVVSTNAKDVW